MKKRINNGKSRIERRNRELERLSAANAKLARANAELRDEIEHMRNDVAFWRGEAKGQERLAGALAAENVETTENKYSAAPETDEAGVVKGCDVPLFFSAASAVALFALIVAAIYAAAC